MSSWKRFVHQDIFFSFGEQFGCLWIVASKVLYQPLKLHTCGISIWLVEDHAHSISHCAFIPFGYVGQQIAHEMDPTALSTNATENMARSLFQSLVRIADSQLDCFQASFHQRAQKCQPEVFIFARTQVKTQQMTLSSPIHTDSDHHRQTDDAMVLPHFQVHGIQPHVWITLLQGAMAELFHSLVQCLADPGYPALIDTCQSKCFQQGVHFSGAYPFQVSFLDHCQQGFLCWPTRFKQTGEVTAFAQFGYRQFDLSNPRLPGTSPVAVAVIVSLRRALMLASAYLLLDFHLHQHLAEQLYAFAQKIGICGPTGAGKSTLINILTRYYDIDSGTILIDGQNLQQLTQASLRKQVGVVLQEAFLFTDTVMNNLMYAREGATEEECIEGAKKANAHDFIMELPQGYDTMLTERGANLSQGQRQMITIARAMVAEPKILILDEATSNVDTRTEKLIQDGMRNLMEGKTSFSIAHRLATIRDSAKIMVLNGGEIVEYASHDELMAAKGFYYALYMSQFKGKAPGGAEAADVDFVST